MLEHMNNFWAFLQSVDLQSLLSTYGYYAVLFLTFLEGETIVILAGIAASQGMLDPIPVALCAFGGSCTSDQLMFFLGKYKGSSMLRRFPRLNKNMDKASVLIKKYDTLLILGFRFIYGVRNVTPIMLGISGVSHVKFLALNIIGAGIWAAAFTAGGFYAAKAFSEVVGNIGSTIFYVFGAALVIGTIIWLIRRRTHKFEATRMASIGRAHNETKEQGFAQPPETTNTPGE